MVEGLHAGGWRQRDVGDHQVELVGREASEQAFESVLDALELQRLIERERRFQETLDDDLRDDEGRAHDEPEWTTRGDPLERADELSPHAEDVFGVAIRHPTLLRELEPPTLAHEELHPERLLELPKLHGDRRLSHPQVAARGRNAPGARDAVEVVEVMIVKPQHAAFPPLITPIQSVRIFFVVGRAEPATPPQQR